MITIEQIHLLEQKVRKAVKHIDLLRQENRALNSKLEHYQGRIVELEKLIESFKRDQSEIERGIITALEELNQLEDDLDSGSSASDSPEPPESPLPDEAPEGSGEPEEADSTDDQVSDYPEADNPQSGELDIF
jgi:chromosome segregation ATPase